MQNALTVERRRELHEIECKVAVQEIDTVRRFGGRWQVKRAGRWRDLDPRQQPDAGAET